MIEEWIDIYGYEGNYQISNFGNVRSLDRNVPHPKTGMQFVKGKELSTHLDRYGYTKISLCKNGKYTGFLVHRLVAKHFINNLDGLAEVDHIDEDKSNNNILNLRWVDRATNENSKSHFIGKRKKLTSKQAIFIMVLLRYYSKRQVRDILNSFGIKILYGSLTQLKSGKIFKKEFSVSKEVKITSKKRAEMIISGLIKKDWHCPCKVGNLEQNICLCDEFLNNYECHCGLFEKVE